MSDRTFQMPMIRFESDSPEARVRVDTRYGYISYSIADQEKALEYFKNEGIRLRICKNIFDDGFVIAGLPDPEKENGN